MREVGCCSGVESMGICQRDGNHVEGRGLQRGGKHGKLQRGWKAWGFVREMETMCEVEGCSGVESMGSCSGWKAWGVAAGWKAWGFVSKDETMWEVGMLQRERHRG